MADRRIQQLELCHREMFGNMVITCANPGTILQESGIQLVQPVNFPVEAFEKKKEKITLRRTQSCNYEVHASNPEHDQRRASALMDELLMEIYNSPQNLSTDYYSTSGKSQRGTWNEIVDIQEKGVTELQTIIDCLREYIGRTGSVLVRQLKRRDALRRQQQAICDVISRMLNERASDTADMRFTIQPAPGESGFSQWVAAMKMVAQLPGGIPPEFRRRLWLTMAERHLASQDIDWSEAEKFCFSEWSHPTDAELGIQIVKDLHRTGCSLFCGENGQENQALLKKVLLAYARWNKAVGYCQGFNMLAALILQVTDRCESDALKLMIYLIEGVLPDSYFADSLRGLSVDMAVFRELLRSKLPRLSKHLDVLQNAAKDGSRSYEPPLTNVFTMQWFLTLFCNCLPQPTVLRVWDLIFLEGNEILLRTALAIWQVLAQRILAVRTADEFYCVMGALTREFLESNLIDANTLIKAIVAIGSLKELRNLRDHYLYNITPWGTSLPPPVEKQFNLHPKQNIPLDISALKKQYLKLKQRQRQAHVIFSSAISGQPARAPAVAINHLLVGKRALGSARRPGPPKGSIPPARQVHPSTLLWKDAEKQSSSSSSSDTELCDDDVHSSSEEDEKPPSKSQLADNLNPGDINFKEEDNSDGHAANVAGSLRASPVRLMSDSEDDSVEFEHFLADRVKCLKENNNFNESANGSAPSHTRRNSKLALQIIQENSMILRRMMQCQSRLSPSPPLYPTEETEANSNPDISTGLLEGINSEAPKMENVYSWIDSHSTLEYSEIQLLSEKPVHSRYNNILEKSKSLDERCNSLFYGDSLHHRKSPLMEGLHESKSETPLGCSADNLLLSEFDPITSKVSSENTLTLASISDDTSNSKSDMLIQQNVDLLKALAATKNKDQPQDRLQWSTRLIKENVDLLKSISSERPFSHNNLDDENYVTATTDNANLATPVTSPNASMLEFVLDDESPESHKKPDLFSVGASLLPNRMLEPNIENFELTVGLSLETVSDLSSSKQGASKLLSVGQCLDECNSTSKVYDFKSSLPEISFCTLDADVVKIDGLCPGVLLTDYCSQSYSLNNEVAVTHQEDFKQEDKDSAISVNGGNSSEATLSQCWINLDEELSSSEMQPSKSLFTTNCESCDTPSTSLNLQCKSNRFCDMSSSSSSMPAFPTFSTRTDFDEPLSLNKSPNHVFNPFPIAVNSRQNKEVPLKLGLYKK